MFTNEEKEAIVFFMNDTEGKKFDTNKLRYDLIPCEALEGLAEVITYGANKYAPNNWQNLPDATNRYYAALLRHIMAWRQGETADQESGLHHLKHALANITFLLYLEEHHG